MDFDLKQSFAGVVTALLVSGVGWTVHSVVLGNKSEAVIAERLAAHDKALERHDQAIEKIDRIESLVDRTTENVARLFDVVQALDERQQSDARELRGRRK